MPNHTSTILTVTGDEAQIQEFIDQCIVQKEKDDITGKTDAWTEFDFNKIIPMPDSLHITSGSTTSDAIALIKAENGDMSGVNTIASYAWVDDKCPKGEDKIQFVINHLKEKTTDEYRKEGQTALDNIEKHGHQSWYSWSIQNWGTKWGAYDYNEIERSEGKFVCGYQTAWSPASPIISKLGELFPELTFVNSYIDEGWGYYGRHTVCGIDEVDMTEDGSCNGDDFINFANDVMGYDLRACTKCGTVHNPDWSEGDGTLCYDCQEKENELVASDEVEETS